MAEQKDYLGSQVGEYQLIRQLGKGTFGTVYLAEHLHDHSQAAVKLLEIQLTGPNNFREFLNEARTIRLRHPHIISLLDFGLSRENIPYLVMEYAVGGTLQQRYPRGTKLPLDIIDSYVTQLASALQYAHDHRVIHRDIKPENVLLGADGAILLSDFGIAKILGRSSLSSLQTNIGTPAYMSPEQSQGKPCPASDQYSLAVMVYEWLTGQLPFQGKSFQVILQHRQTAPSSLQAINPEISIQVEEVILQALSKIPEERFSTILQFSQALHDAIVMSEICLNPPYLSKISSASHGEIEKPQSAHSVDVQEISGKLTAELFSQKLSEADKLPSRLGSSVRTPRSFIEKSVIVPLTSHKRVTIRMLLVTLLCFILLVSLVRGGIWTVFMQQHPSESLHTNVSNVANDKYAYESAIDTNGIQFGFDAQHTHNNTYERKISPSNVAHLVQAWTAQIGVTDSSPAVTNGVVYVSGDSKLYALKANGCGQSTCAPLWTASIGGDQSGASPAVANRVVYISGDSKLYAFKADGCGRSTCAPLWTASIGGDPQLPPAYSSPTVANGRIYVGSGSKLYTFKADGCGQSTCAPLWTAQTGFLLGSSPAVANKVVYIGTQDGRFGGRLYAFKADGCGQSTCAPLWTAQTGDWIGSPPAVANGVVYIGSADSKLYAFKADGCGQSTCASLWTAQTDGQVRSSPAIANGVVYIGSADSKLYAFKADGCGQSCKADSCMPTCVSPLWTAPTGSVVYSSPTIANGVVYIGSEDSRLYAFKANGCGLPTCVPPLWTTPIGADIHSSPAVANGVVYVSSENGKLYAFHL